MNCKVTLKKLISILVVVMLLSAITITPAHAVGSFTQRSRAFIASAITALNIVLQSATMDAASVIESVADPMNVTYTHMDAWQDRPQIQIWDDFVTIDGRPYTDIWISNEAAEKFRIDAYDFITAYNIASNSAGTYATGIGEFDGYPVYSVNGVNRTQAFNMPDPVTYQLTNNIRARIDEDVNGRANLNLVRNNFDYLLSNYRYNWTPYQVFFSQWSGNQFRANYSYNNGTPTLTQTSFNDLYTPGNFSFDYVADNIPASQVLPSDTGMMIRVPSDDGQGNRYFDHWLNDNPEFNQGTPVTIDVNLDPSIETKLDDLLDIIIPIMPIINNNIGDVNFTTNHTEPTPPVQDTLLPDTYWSQLENKLDQIRQTIQNLTPDFSQIIQSIQTIPSAIQILGQNLTQAISNLGDTILQDIEQGPIKVIDKGIDLLKSIFLPILTLLKNALGIWHYVVEWIGNISTPFTWILGIMSSTSSILLSPIYACIAGAIVIAVYRRFGQ